MSDTLNELSSALFKLKQEKELLNERLKVLNGQQREYEMSIWELMTEDKNNPLMKFSTPHGTIYISPQVRPKVVDWDAFYRYIEVNQAFHMLEKRPSQGAFRELHEAHKLVPGVEAVEYDEIRTRKS